MQSETTQPVKLCKFKKLTQSKYFTRLYILPLVDIRSPLSKSYWKTYHCASEITTVGNQVLTKHCKLKYCIVCSRKRCVELIHSYKPVIDTWADKQLLTLTLRNVPAQYLRSTIDLMHKQIRDAKNTINKTRKQQGLEPLRYVGHFETTHNADFDDYHPHMHIIVSSYADGSELLAQWLKRFKATDADKKAQDLTPANESSVRELFKYFTKIISSKKGNRVISVRGLDTIFQAAQGKRTFFASGVTAIKNKKVSDIHEVLNELDLELEENIIKHFEYDHSSANYVNKDTGEALTDYTPTENLKTLQVVNAIKPKRYRDRKPVKPLRKLLKRKPNALPVLSCKTSQQRSNEVRKAKLIEFFNKQPVPRLE